MQKEIATLAGGCFWGLEDLIRKLPGVLDTDVGYAGGSTANPIYEEVKTGRTGHAESLQVYFDSEILSFENLLLYFFKIHDPTTEDQQGNDMGTQYRSVIFYHSEDQKKTSEKVIERVEKSGVWKKPVATELVPVPTFFKAEGYHQDYLEKNPNGYTCHFERRISF
jgi:methionine-S-sulfoxide reductase